ncbi:hypothetical protein C8J57DRAFT_1566314 [Mycena rebaudengoi]|nr:hypothetical protein C8J57DRAFT_1566314 [Mycena rebaudengoi]
MAIANSRARVVTLELTLDSLRQSSKAALSEARGSAESIRADLGSHILILRQRIDALQKAAKERQETQAGHGGQALGPSEMPPANWKASLSEALTMYTEVQRHSDALKARCSALERSEKELVEENRRLEVKARAMTEEVATAMELKSEAEKVNVLMLPFSPYPHSSLSSRKQSCKKTNTLTTTNRELKRAVSELSAAQAESAANARACEEIALQTANAKSKLDKAKKKGGKTDAKSAAFATQVESLTTTMNALKQDLAKTTKSQEKGAQALKKLDKKYREQKDINVQLQKASQDSYDDLLNNNKDLTQRFIMLQQNSLPPPREDRASTSKLAEEYESLKGRHQALQSTLEEMQESYNDLQEGHEQLQQTCDDLETNAELMQAFVAEARNTKAQRSSTESGQLALQDQDRRELEDRVRQLTQNNETIQAQMQNPRIQTAVARALYEDFMERFPSLIPGRHDFHFLEPICTMDIKLHAHLASDPELRAYVNHALYVPKRVVWSSPHYSAGLWIAESEVSGLGGTTRDLFMADDDSIFYVGTYKCHNPEHLYPGGTVAPEVISPLEVMYAAHLGAMTPVDTAVVIKRFYPGGSILVGCVG